MNTSSVFNVAYYILSHVGPVSTMKLQKLVYYCQAWSLAWDGVPLFNEDFQAWANGPVCPELFESHKGKFLVESSHYQTHSEFNFTEEQVETMDEVLKYYGQKQPQWLSNLTHNEDPWKNARNGTPEGAHSHTVISKESMQSYYGGLV